MSSFLIPFKTRYRESWKIIALLAAQSRILEVCPRETRAFSSPPRTPDLAGGDDVIDFDDDGAGDVNGSDVYDDYGDVVDHHVTCR